MYPASGPVCITMTPPAYREGLCTQRQGLQGYVRVPLAQALHRADNGSRAPQGTGAERLKGPSLYSLYRPRLRARSRVTVGVRVRCRVTVRISRSCMGDRSRIGLCIHDHLDEHVVSPRIGAGSGLGVDFVFCSLGFSFTEYILQG